MLVLVMLTGWLLPPLRFDAVPASSSVAEPSTVTQIPADGLEPVEAASRKRPSPTCRWPLTPFFPESVSMPAPVLVIRPKLLLPPPAGEFTMTFCVASRTATAGSAIAGNAVARLIVCGPAGIWK